MTEASDRDEASTPSARTVARRAKDGVEHAREAVSDAYASGKEKAAGAYATAREKARSAGHSATDGLESNPLAVLFGGIAIGAVIGALLPRTRHEAKALGAVSDKIRGAASEAVDAAREAGREKLAELGISRDHARDTVKSLLDGVIAAAGHAGSAAIESARKADVKDTAGKGKA